MIDRNPEALELAKTTRRRPHACVADGSQVDRGPDLTGGTGRRWSWTSSARAAPSRRASACLRRSGTYYVIGYGGKLDVPTIEIISTEINFIGNLVGTYNDLAELMALAAQGKVTLHTQPYPLEAANDAFDDLDNGRLPGTRAILIPS